MNRLVRLESNAINVTNYYANSSVVLMSRQWTLLKEGCLFCN